MVSNVTMPPVKPEEVRYYTPKLSLYAPSIDDEISAMRNNWDRLDQAYSGAVFVNAGAVPDASVLFDGCLVAERSTGIIWRAQKNISGVYEKKYIKYPWRVQAARTVTVTSGTAGVYKNLGYTSLEGGNVNAGIANLVSGNIQVPVTGIYQGYDWLKFNDNNDPKAATGSRALCLTVNDKIDSNYDEDIRTPFPLNNICVLQIPINRRFNKGDKIAAQTWQDSTITLTVTHRIYLSLVRALDA